MKDEIKEILDKLREQHSTDIMLGKKIANDFAEYKLNYKEMTLLLDYITNLQKENEELNRMCELYSKSLYYAELKDYKSRCEEAIEDLKNTKKYNVKLTSEFGDTLVFIDIEHIDYLIEMLGGDNGNMK